MPVRRLTDCLNYKNTILLKKFLSLENIELKLKIIPKKVFHLLYSVSGNI